MNRRDTPAGLDPIETASRDEIGALQLKRLRATLAHAHERVAPFRAKCEARSVHPDDLRGLDDLRKFPFATKADLRQHYPFGLTAVPMDEVVRIHASSGTTGKSTVVTYTQADVDTWADLVARSIRASGGRRGDIVHVAYGYGLFTGGLGAHYGAERLGCAVVPMGGGQTEKQVQLITDFRPRVIMVTPSYALNIVDEMERQGIDPAASSLEIAICGAEPWTDGMRDELERRLGVDAVDIYGLSEVGGPGVANECIETQDGPTTWEDHYYPEIVDPETGDVLSDGEYGELVLTTLTRRALPMIRYRTRDLTRLLPPSARSMRRMDRITGRSDDMLIIRGVNLFPTQVEELVLAVEGLAPHYQLVVAREGNMDTLSGSVELREGVSESASDVLGDELRGRIKSYTGVSARVDVVPPGGVERSLGKAKRVVDRRGLPA